jgi:hypothetical protein
MDTTMRQRRAALIHDMGVRFRITAFPGRVDRPEIVLPQQDYDRLMTAIWKDPWGSALSRGYYLGLGGELEVRAAPAWTFDPALIARARRSARLRRALRHLTR